MGLFDGKELASEQVVFDWTADQVVAFGNLHRVKSVICASVKPMEEILHDTLTAQFDYLELNHHTPLPFQNKYSTPHTLGKDRLAAIAGAQALYPGRNCLVLDCGTCIKYDLLTSEGSFIGGNIAPGLIMRSKAMHHFTAQLPEVSLHIPESYIGSSTQTALQNGAFLGAILEINGFIRRFSADYQPLDVILTGGDSSFLFPHLEAKNKQQEPHLTLYGLNHILTYNRPTSN